MINMSKKKHEVDLSLIDVDRDYPDEYLEMLRSFKVEYSIAMCPNCDDLFIKIALSPVTKDHFCCEECYEQFVGEFHLEELERVNPLKGVDPHDKIRRC